MARAFRSRSKSVLEQRRELEVAREEHAAKVGILVDEGVQLYHARRDEEASAKMREAAALGFSEKITIPSYQHALYIAEILYRERRL